MGVELTDQPYLSAIRQALIGRTRIELPSPTLVLDLRALQSNIETMAAWTSGHAGLRPHAKVHKSAEIARLQLNAGAVGITAATASEAQYLASTGIERILVANEIADATPARALAQLAEHVDIIVGVDSVAGAMLLSRAAHEAGTSLGVLVEVDIGMMRGGVRSTNEAIELVNHIAGLPGLAFQGAMGWEGHTATERNRDLRQEAAAAAIQTLLEVVDALKVSGFTSSIVSAGGTNTYEFTGANPNVTDVQAGTYAIMDTSYQPLSPAFEPVLSVVGTVVSSHGGRVILDCGSKVQATTELAPPRIRSCEGTVIALHEEHALLDLPPGRLQIGDRAELLVSYASGTVNLHDYYAVCDGDEVVDIWAIGAAGTGKSWQPIIRAASDLRAPEHRLP